MSIIIWLITIAGATPVLDSLYARQTFDFSEIILNEEDVEEVETEMELYQLEEMSLKIIDDELIICSTYTTESQGMYIEIETYHPLIGLLLPGGSAKIKATTTGHDTQGANIIHNCQFDGSSSWFASPIQPSPSSYKFTKIIYGSGSRYVLVEGWITDATGWIESDHDQVWVWVNF